MTQEKAELLKGAWQKSGFSASIAPPSQSPETLVDILR